MMLYGSIHARYVHVLVNLWGKYVDRHVISYDNMLAMTVVYRKALHDMDNVHHMEIDHRGCVNVGESVDGVGLNNVA